METLLKSSGGGNPLDNHPVGSWYFSDNSTSPASLFGGAWEQLEEGRGLIAAGDVYTVGSTGGNAEIVQTVEQMPSHNHKAVIGSGGGTSSNPGHIVFDYAATVWNSYATLIANTGGSQPMNILNPYYATYIWRRIA